MSKGAFDKFINPKLGGAKKKETIKQEKKKAKTEARAKADEERKINEAKYGLVTKNSRERNTQHKVLSTRSKSQDSSFTNADRNKKTSEHLTEKHRGIKKTPQSRFVKHEHLQAEVGIKGRGKG